MAQCAVASAVIDALELGVKKTAITPCDLVPPLDAPDEACARTSERCYRHKAKAQRMTSPVITHVHDGPNDDRWRSRGAHDVLGGDE